MEPELAASYHAAEVMARRQARNFYYSFLVLPADKRRAFCAVYAFMRSCDDISDGDASIAEKRAGLQRWREFLDSAVNGDGRANPILPAFRDSLQKYSIPERYFDWIIDGAEMDLGVSRYETFAELYRYCFHVASAVGLVCLQIFGFSNELAREYAEQCGIAFQLTNILRDVKEDAQMGRVYLPAEDLRTFHYHPEELARGIFDDRFRRLMAFESDRARDYYSKARNLLRLVDENSRPSLWAMMEIYSRILAKIVSRGYDVFGSRVRLSGFEKSAVVLRALAMRTFPGMRQQISGTPR